MIAIPQIRLNAVIRSGFYPWLVCFLGALFYCYEYLLRIMPGAMTHELMEAFHLNAFTLGSLSAFYYHAYTPMQLPVGILMDRFGTRKLLIFAIFCCVLGTLLFGAEGDNALWLAELGRFIMGFGSAFAFVGVLKLAAMWLPEDRFALVSGLTTALGMIGGMLGEVFMTRLVQSLGWKTVILVAALTGMILLGIVTLLLHEKENRDSLARPGDYFLHVITIASVLLSALVWTHPHFVALLCEQQHCPLPSHGLIVGFTILSGLIALFWFWRQYTLPSSVHHAPLKMRTLFKDLGITAILSQKSFWIASFIGASLYLSLSTFAELWGVRFLEDAYHISQETAGKACSLVFLGWAVGGPLAGWVSDRFLLRQKPILWGALGTALISTLLLTAQMIPLTLCYLLLFLFGLFSSVEIIVFAVNREITPDQFAATTVALTNMMIMAAGAVLQPLMGFVLDFVKAAVAPNQTAYPLIAYQAALAIIPITALLCAFLSKGVRETHGQVIA